MIIYIGAVIVLIIILIYWKFFKKNIEVTDDLNNFIVNRPNVRNMNVIPKIIWTYWHDLSKVSHIVTKCIDTWIFHNKDYIINILDDNIFKELTGIDINDAFSITDIKTHQKKSDFVRLNIIYLYGGIWLDASMICTISLDWIQDIQIKTNCEYIGYISPDTEHDPVIDSWFLAAIPKSVFLYDWLKEFNKSLSYFLTNNYCKEIISKYPVPNELILMLPYLTIHLCVWLTMYRNPNKYRIYATSATEEGAPLYYMHNHKIYIHTMLKNLSKYRSIPIKLFKLTGSLRTALLQNKKQIRTYNVFINYVMDNKY